MDFDKLVPPYKTKSVEKIRLLPVEERIRRLEGAGLNPFLLNSEDVFIDLLTDSGTSAMSDDQWAGIMKGDESYAGSASFQKLKTAVKEIMGFDYTLPTHQGRGAEHVLDKLLIKEGQIVPGNLHFDTTKAHIENQGGLAVDCTIDEAYDIKSPYPFKGNLDLIKLEQVISKDPRKVAYILITVTCNTGGGHPVSLENIKSVAGIARKHNILLFFDAARYAENAYFIKTREDGYKDKGVRAIIKEMMSYVDGCLMSGKKDALVNIGGFLALKEKAFYQRLSPMCVLMEGFPTYGGMSGRAMEAMAIGLYEGAEEGYLQYRTGQVEYLAKEIERLGVPIMKPSGGHAVYIDAASFLPHIPPNELPGQALVIETYIEGGVRGVEIGTLLAGRDPRSRENLHPRLELFRLAIPRRVYSREHLDYVVECMRHIYQRRNKIRGLKFVYEAPILRHFQSTFAWVSKTSY
jgi:tryptophanase